MCYLSNGLTLYAGVPTGLLCSTMWDKELRDECLPVVLVVALWLIVTYLVMGDGVQG